MQRKNHLKTVSFLAMAKQSTTDGPADTSISPERIYWKSKGTDRSSEDDEDAEAEH